MMRRLLLYLLLILSPFSLAHGDDDASGRRTLTQQELQGIFLDLLQEGLPPRVKEITVSNFSCRPTEVSLPAGAPGYRLAGPVETTTAGRKTLTVLLLVNNEKQGEVAMSGDLHFWGTVVLLTRPLPRRALLAPGDVETDFRDISMTGNDAPSDPDQVVGKKLKKGLRQGAVLFAGLLENPEIVKRGDRVTIMSRRDGLEVTVPGEAKDGGAEGDMVRVKNTMSRRVVQARVVATGLVQVER